MSKQGAKGIEWCDRTVNVVHGCTPVVHPDHPSACERCYAQRMASRLKGRYGYPADEPFRVVTRPDRLSELLKAQPGERVFVASMGDLFHHCVPDAFIAAVFGCFAARPDVTYIVLTKRASLMRAWFEWAGDAGSFVETWQGWADYADPSGGLLWPSGLPEAPNEFPWPLPNVWLVATTESQHWADERIPDLLACPAAVHGVSVEGMLGPVDLRPWLPHAFIPGPADCGWELQCSHDAPDGLSHCGYWESEHPQPVPALDWVICGAEQGPGARPFDWAWAEDLRDQCAEAGVPFFVKRGPNRSEPPADMMIRQWPGGER